MTGQRISVVVPFYNNADLLGDCLASIAAQTYPDLQVIMVDDGSTDGSAAIARAQAAADPRFELVSVRNGGPGSARNHGVAAAAGEFLAFVDADDLLPPDAYATMLAVLDRSGSDFVSGGVLRLSAAGLGRSGLHARAIKARRLGTHISAAPELFYDISVWNKLFRRSFWDAAGLSFPEGMLWEDLVAMTKAHVLARSVDVITDPVYHWRDRDKGAPSITQSRADVGNFRDRFTALAMIDDFLRARGTPAMLRQHQHKALVNDLWLYVRDLPGTSADYQGEFAKLAAGYLRQVTPGPDRRAAVHPQARLQPDLGRPPGRADRVRAVARGTSRPDTADGAGSRQAARRPAAAGRPGARHPPGGVPAAVAGARPVRRGREHRLAARAAGRPAGHAVRGAANVPCGSRAGPTCPRWTSRAAATRPSSSCWSRAAAAARRWCCPPGSCSGPTSPPHPGRTRYSYDWSGFSCDISTRLLAVRPSLADRDLGLLRAGAGPRGVAAGQAARRRPAACRSWAARDRTRADPRRAVDRRPAGAAARAQPAAEPL